MHPRPSVVRPLFVAGAVAAASAVARPAAADAPSDRREPFGTQGQVVLDDLIGGGTRPMSVGSFVAPYFGGLISYAQQSSSSGRGRGNSTDEWQTLSVSPTADVFVAPRLSLGVELSVGWATEKQASGGTTSQATSWSVGFAPRVGYVVPLGAGLSLWPRVALGGGYVVSKGNDLFGLGPGKTVDEIAAVELPLILRVHRLVFLSIEPDVVVTHSTAKAIQGREPSAVSATTAGVDGFIGAGLVL